MKRAISALVFIATAALGLSACGGDDDEDDDGMNGAAGKAGTGGEPASNGGDPGTSNGGDPGAPSGNVECDATQEGVCQNATDCPAVASGEARMAAGSCGQGECLGAKDNTCAIACIQAAVEVTEACADCYAAAVSCTASKCFADCVQDPEADACKACQVEQGCREAFNTCSGLPE